MKNLIYIGLLVCVTYTSCTKDSIKEICDESIICYTDAPPTLYVNLSLSPSDHPIEVRMIKGYYDKGTLLDKFTTNSQSETYLLPVDNRYTAIAKYLVDGDTIMVIDSDELGSGAYKNCDKSCYDWEDEINLDLKLKK